MAQADHTTLNPRPISPGDLEPGDILLSLGDSPLSEAIRALDGGAYSHAALWLGEAEVRDTWVHDALIEATLPNVVKRPISESLEENPRLYVDAYRYTKAGAKRKVAADEALRYEDQPYPSGELVLSALLIATAKWIPGEQRQLKWLVNLCGFNFDDKADLGPKRDQLVMCTELVGRAYLAAEAPIPIRPTPPDSVRVRVMIDAVWQLVSERLFGHGHKATRSAVNIEEWRELQRRSRALLPWLSDSDLADFLVRKPPRFDAGANWLPNRVTPRYLQTSEDLDLIGRVHSSERASELASAERRIYSERRGPVSARATLLDQNPYFPDGHEGPPTQPGYELPGRIALSWEDFDFAVSRSNLDAIGTTADWSVFGYLVADCDLARPIFENVTDMKAIGSSSAMHVGVLFDGPLLTDHFYARLNSGSALRDDLLFKYRELQTTQVPVYREAMRTWTALFPGKHRVMFLGGHGKGWRGFLYDQDLGVNFYEKKGLVDYPGPEAECWARLDGCRKRAMELMNARRSSRSSPRPPFFDLLALDVCFGGNIELALTLHEDAEILVVSEDVQPGVGFPYRGVLDQLMANPSQSLQQFARTLVAAHTPFPGTQTIALSCDGFRKFASEFVALVRVLLDDDIDSETVRTALDEARKPLQRARATAGSPLDYVEDVDLKAFIENLAILPVSALARERCRTALESWSGMILKSAFEGGPSAQNGLKIYAPPIEAAEKVPGLEQVGLRKGDKVLRFDSNYLKYDWKLGFGIWPKFLDHYYAKSRGGDGPG